MCGSPTYAPPPPPPAPPPMLEQLAPKSKGDTESTAARKRKGLSAYKVPTGSAVAQQHTQLGGIPTKSGAA
jgi:hypothetical protein